MSKISAVRAGKRLLALLAVVLLSTTTAWARPTTPEQARNVVANWLSLEAQPMRARLGSAVKEVQTFADEAGNPLYYVVYLAPTGLVLVPADDLVEPIIGFLPAGSYDPSPVTPLGALVSRDIPARVLKARESETRSLEGGTALAPGSPWAVAQRKWEQLANPPSSRSTERGLQTISDVRVSPFVQSKWSQGNVDNTACYNYYTPPNGSGDSQNYVCGCVATAMAQLMRYWQYPTTGVGTAAFTIYINGNQASRNLRGGDGAGGPYDWANMVLDPQQGINSTQRQAIGALTADAGVSAHMQYGSSSSGAYMQDARNALASTFLYANAKMGGTDYVGSTLSETQRNTMINPNLHARYPVLLGIDDGTTGHAIVCDGYGYNSSTIYHHLNMGWAGQDDAWYNLPNIDASYPFNNVDNCIYNVYTTGSGEIIAGRVTNTDGSPVSGATVNATRTEGGSYSTVTESNGIYSLAKVPSASSYNITVTKTGLSFDGKTVTTGTSTDYTTTTGNLWGVDFVAGGGGGGSLAQALDNPTLSVSSGGSGQWFAESTYWYYGGSAAQTAALAVGQSTSMQTTVTGPGTFSFYWCSRSYVWYNYIRVLIDGVEQDRISGWYDWTQKTFEIPGGDHTIVWQFFKTQANINPYAPDCCAWVDKVVFGSPTPSSKRLESIYPLLLRD